MAGKASRKKEPSRLRYIASGRRDTNARKKRERHEKKVLHAVDKILLVPHGTKRIERRAAWLEANVIDEKTKQRITFARFSARQVPAMA
jgi:hypothetical protein